MTTNYEAPWLTEARRYLGQRELPGAPTAPFISRWLQQLGAWWRDDETPWCGTAVAAWMLVCGFKPPAAWYRAKAWATWGDELPVPVVGAVVVFEREGGGHVGLVAGQDQHGRLMVLGGNQGNAVTVAPFDHRRVIAYRWPSQAYQPFPMPTVLPVLASTAPSSTNEA